MATWRPVTLNLTDRWGPLPPHADEPRSPRGLRRLERLLLVVGLILVGYWAYVSIEAALYQRFENQELDAILQSRPVPTSAAPAVPADAPERVVHRPAPGSAVGRIEIPRLGVSAVVRAGTDARTLRLAVGHIPGTAFPGEAGNVGLAGHRDTFFKRLRDIKPDDRIRVVTPTGTLTYRVARTDVVLPTDVWVLDPSDTSILTLVTCYPFSYIGSAPKRFVVRAELL